MLSWKLSRCCCYVRRPLPRLWTGGQTNAIPEVVWRGARGLLRFRRWDFMRLLTHRCTLRIALSNQFPTFHPCFCLSPLKSCSRRLYPIFLVVSYFRVMITTAFLSGCFSIAPSRQQRNQRFSISLIFYSVSLLNLEASHAVVLPFLFYQVIVFLPFTFLLT